MHLPQATGEAGTESLDERIHLYLHLIGSEATPPMRLLGPVSGRPLLKSAVMVALFVLPVAAGIMFSRHGAVAQAGAPAIARANVPADQPSVPAPLPPALAQQLAQPPNVTPPPGALPAGGASAGPAAFGLH